ATVGPVFLVRGNVLPDAALWKSVSALKEYEALCFGTELFAVHLPASEKSALNQVVFDAGVPQGFKPVFLPSKPLSICFPEDIFLLNGDEIRKDFQLITHGRRSAPLSSTNRLLGDQIFLEEGVSVEFSTFNTTKGPIYL